MSSRSVARSVASARSAKLPSITAWVTGRGTRAEDLRARRAERDEIGDEVLAVRGRLAGRVRILLAQDLAHDLDRGRIGESVDADVVHHGKHQREEPALQQDLQERVLLDLLDAAEDGVRGEAREQIRLGGVGPHGPRPKRCPMLSISVSHCVMSPNSCPISQSASSSPKASRPITES